MSSARPAAIGDICVLLAPSRPLSARATTLVASLRAAFGGEVVDPLHVTVDRVATDDVSALIREIRKSVKGLRPAPIRVDRLYLLPSQSRGPEIVKLEVAPDGALDEDVDEILAGVRRCGLPSLYRDNRTAPTITTLQRVTRRRSVDPGVFGFPLELFVADLVLTSRITGIARYEILDTATILATG